MTTQEKLKEIEQQIRKDIPRLMKPTRGCIVIRDNKVFNVLSLSYTSYKLEDIENGTSDSVLIKEFNKHFQIIGHEIMLNDVLEWLGDDFSIDVHSNHFTNGKVILMCSIADRKREKYDEMDWDISSPYLKDQPEELIDFLHNLKNQ